jgi:hypothetical protein
MYNNLCANIYHLLKTRSNQLQINVLTSQTTYIGTVGGPNFTASYAS